MSFRCLGPTFEKPARATHPSVFTFEENPSKLPSVSVGSIKMFYSNR